MHGELFAGSDVAERTDNKMSSVKFAAELPRRIMSVLNLQTIARVQTREGNYILSTMFGIAVVIHPSGAHVCVGALKEITDLNIDALIKAGFQISSDPKDAQKIINKIHIAAGYFWDKTVGQVKQIKIRNGLPPYDESDEAKLLSEPMLVGPSQGGVTGKYLRADFLGHLFFTNVGKYLVGYRGSYQEVLLREVSRCSYMYPLINSCLISQKDSLIVQEFYQRQVASEALSADYLTITGQVYNAAERSAQCITELLAQKIRTLHETEETTEVPIDGIPAPSVAQPVKKSRAGRAPPPPPPAVSDEPAPEGFMSQARIIMAGLNLPVVGTKTFANHGRYTLSLLCGSPIMIDPSGLYIRFFLMPSVYKEFVAEMRAAGLDESEAHSKNFTDTNATKAIRNLWKRLGDEKQAALDAFFMTLPADRGICKLAPHGGSGSEGVTGTYWRADLLPHLLATATGVQIPRYRGSPEEIFLLQQMQQEPLSALLNPKDHLRPAAIRGRRAAAKKHAPTQAPPTPSVSVQSTSTDSMIPIQHAVAASPLEATVVPAPVQGIAEAVSKAKESRELEFQKRMCAFYLNPNSPAPPIPSERDLLNYTKTQLGVMLIASMERAERNFETGVQAEKARNESVIRELRASIVELGIMNQRQSLILQDQIKRAKAQTAGVMGEDEAEPLINEAGRWLGILTRTGGVEKRCGDFLHLALQFGFVMHEVKNGETTICSSEGIDKMLLDIEETEKRECKPCLAAILYSMRSDIAHHRQDTVVQYMAPNGRTLIICVNNVKRQVELSGGMRTALNVFDDALSRVQSHISTLMRSVYYGASHEESIVEQKFYEILGTPTDSPAIQFLSSTLVDNSESIENFLEIVMRPSKLAAPSGVKRVGGLKKRSGSVGSRSSAGPRRTRFIVRGSPAQDTRPESDGEVVPLPPGK